MAARPPGPAPPPAARTSSHVRRGSASKAVLMPKHESNRRRSQGRKPRPKAPGARASAEAGRRARPAAARSPDPGESMGGAAPSTTAQLDDASPLARPELEGRNFAG